MQESTDVKLTKEVKGLLTGQQKQNTELEEIRKKADTPRVGKSINRMPENCKDLHAMGHTLNGIYPVRSGNYIEMVHCEMTTGK